MTKKLAAIKGLLFDKDGTLFDFEKTWNSWTSRILCEVSEQSADCSETSHKILDVQEFQVFSKSNRVPSLSNKIPFIAASSQQ